MIQTIKDFKHAQPFKPFDIKLFSGRVLCVETPDHVAFAEMPGRYCPSDDGEDQKQN